MSRIWKTPQQVDVNQDPGLIPPATPRESLGVGFTDTVNTETTSSQTTGNIVNNIYITRTAGPGGRSGELQFNEGGAYIGDSGLFYDPNTDTLTTGTININQLNANGANLGSVNNLTILGGNNNNVLKTNGSGVVTWASAFPPDGSNSGKFLMTNGISQVWSNVSYANLVDVPANIATQSYVGNAIANLVDSSPAALNTLNELATALGNNANYATDITSILANKANITYVDNVTANITWANLSGKPTIPAEQINSDWTEINSLSKAFIQNKPTLGNISNINISGSSTQVLYGNGVFEYLPTGSGIALTDLSIGAPNSASGGGGLSYANSTGVFTYTPPVIPTSFSNLVNGSHTLSLGSTGKLTLPTTGIVRNGTDTAQVGSTTTIATDSNSGTGNQTPRVVDVPFSAPIISTYSPGSTITFQNGDIRTITGIVQQSGGGGYLDINYSGAPTTSNPEFPIILKTADYAAATTAPEWYFSTTGNLTLPNGAVIRDTAGDAIAFGQDAGLTTQGTGAVAIGTGAGYSGQGNSAVAIGYNAGVTTQGTQAVAIGINAGVTTQGNNSVAIGPGAGASAQGTQAVAIGTGAGEITQGNSAVAVGYNAGLTSQGNQAVAFGQNAGANSQAAGAVAIGVGAGQTTQQLTAVAVGDSAGYNTQGLGAVGVGAAAGFELQGEYAVALGYFAGNTSQGNSAVAIGKLAGNTNQGNNSIILNATGAALDQTTANTFTVKPVRQANTANAMYYDASTGEITYDTAGGGGNTGNVTFNDQAVVGTGDQVGSSGLYLAPGTESVGNLQYIRVRGGDVATHIHLDTGNNAYFDQYFGDDIKYVKLAAGGNVVIGTDDANGNSAQWTFGTNGNLTLPSNLVIGTGAGSGSRIFQYDDGLEIVGEGANSVVLMGWTANISAPDSVATIAMNYPSGGEGNILIAVGNNATTVHSWLFGNDGNLTLPANTFAVNYANGTQVTLGDSYGNSDVATFLTSYGSNTIATTGNVSVGNLSTAGNITGNTNGFAIGYLNIPQVAAANATLALTDAGKHYYSTSAGNFTLTIPTNATVAFATGTAISIVVQSAGNVLINAASGVTLYMAGNSTAANRVASTYAMATLMKVASDTWMINGTGVS